MSDVYFFCMLNVLPPLPRITLPASSAFFILTSRNLDIHPASDSKDERHEWQNYHYRGYCGCYLLPCATIFQLRLRILDLKTIIVTYRSRSNKYRYFQIEMFRIIFTFRSIVILKCKLGFSSFGNINLLRCQIRRKNFKRNILESGMESGDILNHTLDPLSLLKGARINLSTLDNAIKLYYNFERKL